MGTQTYPEILGAPFSSTQGTLGDGAVARHIHKKVRQMEAMFLTPLDSHYTKFPAMQRDDGRDPDKKTNHA